MKKLKLTNSDKFIAFIAKDSIASLDLGKFIQSIIEKTNSKRGRHLADFPPFLLYQGTIIPGYMVFSFTYHQGFQFIDIATRDENHELGIPWEELHLFGDWLSIIPEELQDKYIEYSILDSGDNEVFFTGSKYQCMDFLFKRYLDSDDGEFYIKAKLYL